MSIVSYKIIEKNIALITLNRPQSANSLSIELLINLQQTIKEINKNDAIYCTIFSGSGSRFFCAGADLKERKQMSDVQVVQAVQLIGDIVSEIEQMRMPAIAALNGDAYGGGLELALGCDFRIIADHAKIGLPEATLAIIPGAGGTQRLPRLIGPGQAKRLIFTGKPITAKDAFRMRLVEEVVSSDQLLSSSINMAKTISNNGPIALQEAKKAIYLGMNSDLITGLSIEHLCYQQTIGTKDRLEGLQAFAEKRVPKYKGK